MVEGGSSVFSSSAPMLLLPGGAPGVNFDALMPTDIH